MGLVGRRRNVRVCVSQCRIDLRGSVCALWPGRPAGTPPPLLPPLPSAIATPLPQSEAIVLYTENFRNGELLHRERGGRGAARRMQSGSRARDGAPTSGERLVQNAREQGNGGKQGGGGSKRGVARRMHARGAILHTNSKERMDTHATARADDASQRHVAAQAARVCLQLAAWSTGR